MEKVELIQEFDQTCFSSSSSEEEIVLLRSEYDLWSDSSEFVDACREYAWGDLISKPVKKSYFDRFFKDITSWLGAKFVLELNNNSKDFTLVCDDWNAKALMWSDDSYYFMLCWSTTA